MLINKQMPVPKSNLKLSYIFALPLVLLLINAVLISCKKETTTASIDSGVLVRIINLSPDVYPVQLYINNVIQNPLNSTTTLVALQTYASYKYNIPSGYFTVRSSNSPLQLRSTKVSDSILITLDTAKVHLRSGLRYSLFLTGLTTDRTLDYTVTVDTAQTPSLGRGKVRYVNASLRSNTNGYDIYANGTLAFQKVAYPKTTNFIELPAGTYDFKFVPAGSSVNESSNVLMDLPNITILDGRLYTLYSRGITGRLDSAAIGAAAIANN